MAGMDELKQLNEAGQEALGFFGTITSLFSMAWNTLWTVGIMGVIGWFAYQTDVGKDLIDKGFAWLADTDIGKSLINMLGGFMEMLGFDHPLKNASIGDIAAGLATGDTPSAHDREIATLIHPHWNEMVDAGLITQDSIATPDGLKKLTSIMPDATIMALMRNLKNAPTATDPKLVEQNAAFMKKLNESVLALGQDATFMEALRLTRPETARAIDAAHMQQNLIKSGITNPEKLLGFDANDPKKIAEYLTDPTNAPNITALATNPDARKLIADMLTSAGASNPLLSLLTKRDADGDAPNLKAIATLLDGLKDVPADQKTTLVDTLTGLMSGKPLDASKATAIAGFFSVDANKAAVTAFISSIDVSGADATTQKIVEVLKDPAHSTGIMSILSDPASIDYIVKTPTPEGYVATATYLYNAPTSVKSNVITLNALQAASAGSIADPALAAATAAAEAATRDAAKLQTDAVKTPTAPIYPLNPAQTGANQGPSARQ